MSAAEKRALEAAELFVRKYSGRWTDADESALQSRLQADPEFADSLRRVEHSWHLSGKHATAPSLMILRQQALRRARLATHRPWRIATAAAIVGLALAATITVTRAVYQRGWYETQLGEQRTLELEDRSRLVLDSRTRLHVRFTDDARVVELVEGRAQFSVSKDPRRPFKVSAGGREVIALGTVFTVERVDREMNVTMFEGRVAVVQTPSPGTSRPSKDTSIELVAGQALRVDEDGKATMSRGVDLTSAGAWQQGKTIFNDETLATAVQRINRHARARIVIDDAELAGLHVSGVFDTGDVDTFTHAVEATLPVTAEYSEDGTIKLIARAE
jgi:transmembrane sensor